MFKLGLKSSANFEQLQSRLKYKPTVFEFHTSEQDFTKEGLKVLEEGIQLAKASGVQQIVLHHPMFYKGQMLELVAKPSIHKELVTFIDRSTENLLDLAYLHDCQVLVHGSYEIQTQQFLEDYSSLAEATDFLWQKLILSKRWVRTKSCLKIQFLHFSTLEKKRWTRKSMLEIIVWRTMFPMLLSSYRETKQPWSSL